jgi:hypothetical protein
MTGRRVVPLLLAVAGLIALAALAAHGHPLTGSRGSGPTPRFFDYVYTTFAILAIAIAILFVYGVLGSKWSAPTGRARFSILQFVFSMAAALLFAWLVLHAHFHFLSKLQKSGKSAKHALTPSDKQRPNAASIRNARLRWDEVAVVAALLAAVGVAAFAGRKARPLRAWSLRAQEEQVALALDESLDDLRSDPDVRRAIIAAYARMERALAAAGIPRRPSEAPYEYLARALGSLHTSAASVTRLTDLFEHAKFSQHVPDESMRADAIDALVAVRDELRAPVEAAA